MPEWESQTRMQHIVLNSSQSHQSTEEKGMFDNLEYKHTAEISADAWFIRFWAWMWETDARSIDFCKLFWGYVFAIPNLLFRAIIFPFWLTWQGLKAASYMIDDWLATKQTEKTLSIKEAQALRAEEKAKEEIAAAKKRRREERIAKFFGFVSTQADRVVGIAKTCWPVARIILIGLGAILGLIVATGAFYLIYLLVDLVINNSSAILNVLIIIGAIVGVAVTAVLIVFAIALFFTETRLGRAIADRIKRAFGDFGQAIWAGFIGVKTRTCPKIELIDSPSNNEPLKGKAPA